MKPRQDAFGNWAGQTKKMSVQDLNPSFYGLILLQCELEENNIPNLLWEHTKLMFRPMNNHLFSYQEKELTHTFPTFAAYKPSNKDFLPFYISNNSLETQTPLISYQKPSVIKLTKEKNILPNQLALFEEESNPLALEEDYTHINANDLQSWNEIGNYLQKNSIPMSFFQYLMPISIHIGEMLHPFLIHINNIDPIKFQFISGNELKNPELFYLFESYRNERLIALRQKQAGRR